MSDKQEDARRKAVSDAAYALSDLNMFAAVQTLMEHSLVSSRRFAAEAAIVRICEAEKARCLHEYDVATAKAVKARSTP